MEVPKQVLLWQFGGIPGNFTAIHNYQNNQGYNLHCEANCKFLTWVKNQLSINLGFITNPTERKIHFSLPDGNDRVIMTGEPVAFGIGGGEAFLFNGSQRFGLNLKWNKEPKFEWRILGASGKHGEPVTTGERYALLNVEIDPDPDFLIHVDQKVPRVVDLAWTSSPLWLNKMVSIGKLIKDIVQEYRKEKQQA